MGASRTPATPTHPRRKRRVRRCPLRITTHAQVEAFKDGLTLADLRAIFQTGMIIEDYPEQDRALVVGGFGRFDVAYAYNH